jgi:hypothetical protein
VSSIFDRQFTQSGFPQLEHNFGEPVTYHFRGGGERELKAIIDRDPPAIYDAGGNVVMPEFTIRFSQQCGGGIKANEIDTGGDEVSLIAKIGEMIPVRKTVLQMQSQDSGVIVLALK